MMSHEENELRVRVGAGTATGQLMREHWLPSLLSRGVEADVPVANVSTGVMERLGLGQAALRAAHPKLIFSSVSACNREGLFADRMGFDPVVQAESGFVSMNGCPDRQRTAAPRQRQPRHLPLGRVQRQRPRLLHLLRQRPRVSPPGRQRAGQRRARQGHEAAAGLCAGRRRRRFIAHVNGWRNGQSR